MPTEPSQLVADLFATGASTFVAPGGGKFRAVMSENRMDMTVTCERCGATFHDNMLIAMLVGPAAFVLFMAEHVHSNSDESGGTEAN